MHDLQQYVQCAKKSVFFSGANIDEHLRTFLRDSARDCEGLGREYAGRVSRIYLVGSGGSFVSMQTAKYALDELMCTPLDAVMSYDLLWRRPRCVDENALVFLASYSGETEDTLAALRFAKERGARTVAIVGNAKSTLARSSDVVVSYDSGAMHEIPVAALILFAGGFLRGTPSEDEARLLRQDLLGLPETLRRTLTAEEKAAEGKARDLLPAHHVYVLGAGPLGPLAYKLATVIMENVRIGATFLDASEWRHGPVEAMERMRAQFVVLVGTDASRQMTLRVLDTCRRNRSDVLIYDAAEFGHLHPLLTPLVMNSHVQWLIVYSAILRGITNLDERIFMGRGVLSTGVQCDHKYR